MKATTSKSHVFTGIMLAILLGIAACHSPSHQEMGAGSLSSVRIHQVDPQLYNEKLAELSQRLMAHPEDAGAWAERGFLNSKLGEPDSALKDFERALSLDAGQPYAVLYLAMHMESQEMLAASLNFFDKAVLLKPNDPYFHYCRGSAYYHQGRLDKACEAWRKQAGLGDPNGKKLVKEYCGG